MELRSGGLEREIHASGRPSSQGDMELVLDAAVAGTKKSVSSGSSGFERLALDWVQVQLR